MDPWSYFRSAAAAAIKRTDERAHRLGAVGLRSDGALVVAVNGTAKHKIPAGHAEARLVRKLDRYAIVFVARWSDAHGFMLARPCSSCVRLLRARRVTSVYYTISDYEYGVLHP